MNLLKKKTGELAPSGTSNGAIPYVNPAMKRKREEETFQKTLIQKNHPPMKLSSTNILTVTVPLKIKDPIENPPTKRPPSDTETNIKQSVQKFAQNYKKNTVSKEFQVDDPTKTRPTKDSKFDKQAKPVLNIKKVLTVSSVQKSIDETLKEIAQFERRKEPLLTDLSNLLEELEDKTNPLLRSTEERIDDIKTSTSRLTVEHREKMKNLTERIKFLREERMALSAKLEEKKKSNLESSAEKDRRHQEIRRINQSIFESKLHLEDLQKKSHDLNKFINNIEIGITSTRGLIRQRCDQYLEEQGKNMALQEMICNKQRNVRSMILVRQNKPLVESDSFYKVSIHDQNKVLKLEITIKGEKTPAKYYNHDGLFYIDNYQQKYDELFQNQDEHTFKNILLNTLKVNENKKNFFFNIVSRDNYKTTIFHSFLNILNDMLEPFVIDPILGSLKFNSQGEITKRKHFDLNKYISSIKREFSYDDSYELWTFTARLEGFEGLKRFVFLLTEPHELNLLQNINKLFGNSSSLKKGEMEEEGELNFYEAPSIFDILKRCSSFSSMCNILTLPSKGDEPRFAMQLNDIIAVLRKENIDSCV